jgi:hypothetical protein
MSSTGYETVFESYNQEVETDSSQAPRKLSRSEKLKQKARAAGGAIKKGAVVVAKKAKAAAGAFMWYVRAFQIICVILLIAYLYKTFF